MMMMPLSRSRAAVLSLVVLVVGVLFVVAPGAAVAATSIKGKIVSCNG